MGLEHQEFLAFGHVENFSCRDLVHHLRVPVIQRQANFVTVDHLLIFSVNLEMDPP